MTNLVEKNNMEYGINYDILPEHIRDGMRRHIEHGGGVGGFLQTVLEDRLVESFGKADEINRERLGDIAWFLYNEAPAKCWGSSENVQAWRRMHGLAGLCNKGEV